MYFDFFEPISFKNVSSLTFLFVHLQIIIFLFYYCRFFRNIIYTHEFTVQFLEGLDNYVATLFSFMVQSLMKSGWLFIVIECFSYFISQMPPTMIGKKKPCQKSFRYLTASRALFGGPFLWLVWFIFFSVESEGNQIASPVELIAGRPWTLINETDDDASRRRVWDPTAPHPPSTASARVVARGLRSVTARLYLRKHFASVSELVASTTAPVHRGFHC